MPTILRIEGYRFFFFSNEHLPEHMHVENGDKYARIELGTLKVTDSYNLSSKELKKLLKIVESNHTELQRSWDDYFTE